MGLLPGGQRPALASEPPLPAPELPVPERPPAPDPPHVRGIPGLGLLPRFRRDPLGTLTDVARRYGPLVRARIGRGDFLLLSEPEYIEQVLVVQQHRFVKGRGVEALRAALGEGLLTSEGEFWRRQRRLAQPAFHRQRVASYGETMVAYARRHVEAWRDGEERDLAAEMARLTLAIAAKTLFNVDIEAEASRIGRALDAGMKAFVARTRSLLPIPEHWPTPTYRRFRRALAELDAIVYGIIEQRRASGEDPGDLLSLLMKEVDEQGEGMTVRQLRDETLTLLLAGHETMANALSWTFYLLARHPDVAGRLRQELARVLGGRDPTAEDVPRLPYAGAVIRESMRLYPPAWVLGRKAVEPFELGPHRFPAGTQVLMSQWVVHRDPRWYEDAETFRPERWLGDLPRRLPAFAYFPFGGGPRRCIGEPFAGLEAVLVLAVIARRFDVELVPGARVEPEPVVTLRLRYGLPVRLRRVRG